MAECTVYIDEAGDLGIKRGTRWVVLSAVIVRKMDEPDIRNRMKRIKQRLNVNEIHLRKIMDFNKRGYIVRELASEKFVFMNIIVDTNKFEPDKIPSSAVAYNYICKYLLQRVSIYLNENELSADIVLSARGTSRDGELIEYIIEKLFPFDYNRIATDRFEKVEAKTAGIWDLLQLADVCATSMFLSHEINAYDICVPCFANALTEHLYRKNDAIEKFGIKYFTDEMKADIGELEKHYVCKKKELPAQLPHDKHAG